jgi:capsular polysaccharide export protein
MRVLRCIDPKGWPARLHRPAVHATCLPHPEVFWPEAELLPAPGPGVVLLLPEGAPAAGEAGAVLRATPGPFRPAHLGGRERPVALLAASDPDPIGALLARPGVFDPALARAALAALAAARLGGPPGLPDPGGARLGAPGLTLLLDPGVPGARARLAALHASGRPYLVAADPFSPGAAVLPGSLPRLDPWSLLDVAGEVHGASRSFALLALAAGVPLRDGPFAGRPPEAVWAPLLAALRCADPFHARPCSLLEAIDILALWKRRAAAGAPIAACLGVRPFNRAPVRALLAGATPPPSFHQRPAAAIRAARARGGAVLAWASHDSRGLRRRAADDSVPLHWIEDGFLRSAGLGTLLTASASFTIDTRGPQFDPAAQSDLDLLIEAAEIPPALLARAARLRALLVARGATKYDLPGTRPGAAAPLPPAGGRPRILVPGQVEDDASVRLGAGPGFGNLAMLRAVRACAPDAFLIYKPHPDIEAGFRRGRVPRRALAGLVDHVAADAPMAPLLAAVDAVHTMTSLSGFEALLRGLPVTVWGRPFYAGLGLTEDRLAPLRPRRRRSLDELVAIALILYPAYVDPRTSLPCPPEVLLERLGMLPPAPVGAWALLRAWQGGARAALARLAGWR